MNLPGSVATKENDFSGLVAPGRKESKILSALDIIKNLNSQSKVGAAGFVRKKSIRKNTRFKQSFSMHVEDQSRSRGASLNDDGEEVTPKASKLSGNGGIFRFRAKRQNSLFIPRGGQIAGLKHLKVMEKVKKLPKTP